MKSPFKRSKPALDMSLRIMKAALLVAVALVSGVVVMAIAYDLIFFWGITILYLAVQIAIGISIGSLVYTVCSHLASMFTDSFMKKQMATIIRPFVWSNIDPDGDAPFTA
jgi:uncharacterized membrane protein YGL010W